MPREPRVRTTFPSAEGWVVVENNTQRTLEIALEPWGAEGKVLPGETVHVLLVADWGNQPTIIIHHDTVQIYCADAIYRDGVEIIDLTD